jgi:transketolase
MADHRLVSSTNKPWSNLEAGAMNERRSMRVAYGTALATYGAVNDRVVVLDADVSASTHTHYFARAFPQRFFNVGVAEAGMVDVAVGLALAGKIPFVNTFGFLLALRAAEQIRTCTAYARTNVKLVGSYGGLSDSFDGPTHHSVCDLAIMRSLPNMTVVVAADAIEASKLVPAVAEHDGPVYLRLSRAEVPILYDDDYKVEIGRGTQLCDGTDVTLIATGIMVSRTLTAAGQLAREGVQARVLSLNTIKPLDRALILSAAEDTGAVVTVEEHSVIGGLGSAVAELLAEESPRPVVRVGLRDVFAETGPYEALLNRYGMAVDDIVAAARRAVALRDSAPQP